VALSHKPLLGSRLDTKAATPFDVPQLLGDESHVDRPVTRDVFEDVPEELTQLATT
jgi:hypothetical protein